MDFLQNTLEKVLLISGIENPYWIALFIVLVTALAGWVLLFVFNSYLKNIAGKTKTKIDDIIFSKTKRPFFFLVLVLGIRFALFTININDIFTSIVNSLLAIIFLLLLSRIFDIIIDTWGHAFAKRTKTKIDEVVLPLFHKATRVIFVIIAFMWTLSIWNLNITPYLTGAGIAGLVLGLALQDSLRNIFGGITLLLDKTYQIGDKVKLDDSTVGTIHDIGLRSTKLITFDNEIIYIPNGYLANSRVQNYTRPNPKVRSHVFFGIEYGADIEKVRELILSTLKKIEGVLEDPEPTVHFLEMGDFALKFKAAFWVEHWDEAYGIKLKATEAIYKALQEANIGIPFPTQTIHLRNK